MEKLILSPTKVPAILVNRESKTDHANLKNLGFEESGHTGFQPALTEEQLKNIEKVMGIEENLNASIEHIDSVAEKVDAFEESISEIKSTAYRLIRRLTVEEDVASVAISKDEDGKAFKITDFEVRFSGKHTGTMWIQLNKGEKYVSINQINNNQGLPFYSTVSHSYKNAVARFIYSGSNYYGVKYEQMIGNLTDGTYSAGAGSIAPFNTSPVSSLASQVVLQAISTNGVIKAGTVIEIWGY